MYPALDNLDYISARILFNLLWLSPPSTPSGLVTQGESVGGFSTLVSVSSSDDDDSNNDESEEDDTDAESLQEDSS